MKLTRNDLLVLLGTLLISAEDAHLKLNDDCLTPEELVTVSRLAMEVDAMGEGSLTDSLFPLIKRVLGELEARG